MEAQACSDTLLAGNLLRKSSSGVQGQSPGGGLGTKAPEAGDKYANFQLRRGGTWTYVPLMATPLFARDFNLNGMLELAMRLAAELQ